MACGAGPGRLAGFLFVPAAVLAASDPALAASHHAARASIPHVGSGLAAAFLFGLLGSTHCFGMCGPLVSLNASQFAPGAGPSPLRQHFLFSLGTVPMMWGIGVVGQHLSPARRLAWQRVFGGLVTVWGLVLIVHGLQSLGVF